MISSKILYSSVFTLVVSVLFYLFVLAPSNNHPVSSAQKPSSMPSATPISSSLKTASSRLRPVFFTSHGGPTFMYRDDDFGDAGAWDTVNTIGKEILNDPPKALLVISAHWQEPNSAGLRSKDTLSTIGITSTDGENSLIYDFHGFPRHMYEEQFHTNGSKEISRSIAQILSQPQELPDGSQHPGFNVKLYGSRGFDHGLWVPLRVAFPEYSKKSLGKSTQVVPFPVLQISLPSTPSDMRSHRPNDIEFDTRASFALGQAIRELRDRQGADMTIICSGMSVHNLRDLFSSSSAPAYSKSFDNQLKQTVESTSIASSSPQNPLQAITDLFKKPITKQAHPSLEHIMPMAVALGANTKFVPKSSTFDPSLVSTKNTQDKDGNAENVIGPIDFKPKEIYTNTLLSLAWGIYRFGKE